MAELRKMTFMFTSEGYQKLERQLNTLSENATQFGKKMKDVGGTLTKSLTLPLVGVGTAGTKMFLDVDTGLRKVMTLADQSVLPFSRLQTEIKGMSNEVGIMQTELLEATYEALSSGVETEDVLTFVRSGVDLTRAGFTDMATAIDATTTVLNAYGDNAYDVTKIHDIFVQTQDKGKITVDELGKSIGRVIPVASSLGVNIDQLGAGYAMLTARGQNARIATTNLNAMFSELGATGSNVDKVLRASTGKSFAQLTEDGQNVGEILSVLDRNARENGLTLKDMFGSMNAGAAAVTLLSEGVEGYNKELQGMHDADGVTAKNAETTAGAARTLSTAWVQIKNALIELGAVIAPVLEKFAEWIGNVATKMASMDEKTIKAIVTIGAIVAAIGPLLSILGTVATAIGFIANPVGLVVAAVVAAVALIIANWDKIKEKIGAIVEWFQNIFQKVRERDAAMWEAMKEKAGSFVEFLKSIPGKVFEIAKNIVSSLWEGLKGLGKGVWNNTLGRIPGLSIGDKDGSHRTGLAQVPYDGYRAELHRGEEVLSVSDPRNSQNKGAVTQGESGTQNIFNITISGTPETSNREWQQMIEDAFDKCFNLKFTKVALARGAV